MPTPARDRSNHQVSSYSKSVDTRELYRSLIGNPDNQYYLNLLELVTSLYEEAIKTMLRSTDKDEILRLQGRAQGFDNFRASLTRKPVETKQYTGSFS
jgi:hypothetical protein